MILPFSTKFPNGTPTYFIQKIWAGLSVQFPDMANLLKFDYENAYQEKFDCLWDGYWTQPDVAPKLHTIREDAKDRWHAGRKIHLVVFNRSKNQFRFAPVLECKSVQRIEVKWINQMTVNVHVDGRRLNADSLIKLAKNDGFETLSAFLVWFKRDFTGKIIHWTDLKY